LAIPREVKDKIPYGPGISLLGKYPREMKTYVHTKTCIEMFIAAKVKGANNPNIHQRMNE
jgi:hypothetical protein